MKFTAEHEALRRTARQFVENELNPNIRMGRSWTFPDPRCI